MTLETDPRRLATRALALSVVGLLALSTSVGCGPDRFKVSYRPLAVRAVAPPPVEPEPQAEPTNKIAISEKIRFRLGSFEILEASFDVLNHVASVMKRNPQIKRVEVQGHTDYFGSLRRNMYVSRERAKAVRDYLIEQGVAPQRLEFRGYGPNQPVGDNETAEGREQNRRVEFVIVEGALAHGG